MGNKSKNRKVKKQKKTGKSRALLGTLVLQKTNKLLENFIVTIMEAGEPITESFFDGQSQLLDSVNDLILDLVERELEGKETPEELCTALLYIKTMVTESYALTEFLDKMRDMIDLYRDKICEVLKVCLADIEPDLLLAASMLPAQNKLNFLKKSAALLTKTGEEYLNYVKSESDDIIDTYRAKLVEDVNKILKGLATLDFIEEFDEDNYEVSFFYHQDSLRADLVNFLSSNEEPTEELHKYNKIKYIEDYKDLNNLAKKHGYVYKRDNGDHGIFINNKCNVVVIPQGRSIGKGLSIHIQKTILKG